MSVKNDLAMEARREKARNQRYKKAVSVELNLDSIKQTLWDMQEASGNVRWWCAQADETMLDELIGDEEESYELRMAFSTLEADCMRMIEDLDNEWVPEFFDDFFGTIAEDRMGGMMGFDSYEGDYFGIADWETKYAAEECHKRLKTHTKDEIIEAYSVCFRVAINFIALRSRFDGMKSYIDILNGQNTGFLATVKRIEDLYEKISDPMCSWQYMNEFEALVKDMPDEAWIQ